MATFSYENRVRGTPSIQTARSTLPSESPELDIVSGIPKKNPGKIWQSCCTLPVVAEYKKHRSLSPS